MRLPGARLLALARLVVDAASLSRIVEPAIADLQHEWRASDDSPFRARVSIRARAYTAALVVLGCHLVVGAARASVTPPPWTLVRKVIVPSIVMLAVTFGVRAFLQMPRGDTDVWLLEIAYWIPLQMAWMPFLWATMLPRRSVDGATLPTTRASDIARLTAAWCLLCLLWTGWIAPFVRQQYLIQVGQAMRAANIEQWTLPSLLTVLGMDGMPTAALELHRRLVLVALTPIAGVLTWITLRPRRHMPNSPFAAHLVRGIVLAIAAMAIGTAFESSVGPIGGAWVGVIVALTGALLILVAFRLADTFPREPMEREA